MRFCRFYWRFSRWSWRRDLQPSIANNYKCNSTLSSFHCFLLWCSNKSTNLVSSLNCFLFSFLLRLLFSKRANQTLFLSCIVVLCSYFIVPLKHTSSLDSKKHYFQIKAILTWKGILLSVPKLCKNAHICWSDKIVFDLHAPARLSVFNSSGPSSLLHHHLPGKSCVFSGLQLHPYSEESQRYWVGQKDHSGFSVTSYGKNIFDQPST